MKFTAIWTGVFLLSLFSTSSMAQEEKVGVTLDKVLERAGAENLTIREYELNQERAVAEHTRSKEWLYPELYAGVRTHNLWGTDMNTDGRFFRDVSREFFWGGGGIDVGWDLGEGIYSQKAASKRVHASEYRTEAIRNQTLLKAIDSYYDLFIAQLKVQAYRSMIARSDSISDQVERKSDQGLMYESEGLLTRSNANQLKLKAAKARTEQEQAASKLAEILALEHGKVPVIQDSALVPLDFMTEEDIPEEHDTAFQARPEHTRIEWEQKALETERKGLTSGMLLPDLRAGTYGTMYGPPFGNLDPTSALNFSLTWEIPLGRVISGGELKTYDARIKIQENRKERLRQQVDAEVRSAKEKLRLMGGQLETAEESVELAKRALEQTLKRQELGTARPFEMLQAQEMYMKAQLALFEAVAGYNSAQYELFVALGNNL